MTEKLTSGNKSCPLCGSSVIHRYRPFCSKRCADIDLSRWMGGAYAVPVVQLDES
ncbi:DNA gyrase inhibitor YacG, partial [Vibrio parahaemolyticus]|uniref:DNA gyrase inhibitor YacG n=1 Tax=Vibrio parahaemolyticus TaxID=670 RepID=UPI0035292936